MNFKQISEIFRNLKKKSSRFFTIIEVLVVISIIGIISGLVIISQANTRSLARDKKRIADLAAYQNALQEYYSQHKQYPIVTADCTAHTAGCLDVLEQEDFLSPLPEDPLNFNYTYTQNDDAVLPPDRGGSEYKLYVALEIDTQAMIRDGGSEVALYEVFSTLGSRIVVSYVGRGVTKYLTCDVTTIDECNFQGGINVLGLAGKTASVDFTGGAHSQIKDLPWLSGWEYRKPVIIDNAGGPDRSNYQVEIDTTHAVYHENGLVGSWHFNEGSGTVAYDMSGYRNVGSLQNFYPSDVIANNPSLEKPWYLVVNQDVNHRIERPDKWTVSYNFANSDKMLALQETNIVRDGSSAINMTLLFTGVTFDGYININNCGNKFLVDETEYLEGGNFQHAIKGPSSYGDQTFLFYDVNGNFLSRRWAYATNLDADVGDGWRIKSYVWRSSSLDPNPPTQGGNIPYIPKGAKYACFMQYFVWKGGSKDWEAIFDKFFIYQWSGMPTNEQRISRTSSGWVDGKFGTALNFDGTNDYVSATNVSVDTSARAKNTVAFWMYWTGGNSQMPIGWQGSSYDLWFQSGCFGFNTGQGNILGVSSAGLANSWHYVVAIFYNGTPTNNVSLYIDGMKQSLSINPPCFGPVPSSRTVSSTFIISGWDTTLNYKFGGRIDEVRVYNRALRESEISALFNASKARLDYGDIRFTDENGTTLLTNGWQESDKKFWVTIPSILADYKKTIYLYYGNPTETALYPPKPGIFADGFENGSWSPAWSGQSVSNGTLSFLTISPYKGNYHARFVSDAINQGGSGRVYKNMPATYKELYMRGYYKFGSLIGGNNQEYGFNMMRSPLTWALTEAKLRRASDTFFWRLSFKGTNTDSSTFSPQPDKWYCIELYAKVGTASGEAKLWIDDSLVASRSGVDVSGDSYLNQVWTGVYKNDVPGMRTFDYDDIIVSNTYIGCDPTPPVPITRTLNSEQTQYDEYSICCYGPPDIGADCTATNNVPVLNLSDKTNAHVQEVIDFLTDWRYKRPIEIDNTVPVSEPEEFPPSMAGWSYRKSHVIEPAAGAGTNYPIRIKAYYGNGIDTGENVYLSGNIRTDFGDVRFTDDDGETILDYWMEEKVDGNYAIFWVEVRDDLIVNPQTIYIYYDNPTQTYDGNPDNLFGYTTATTYTYLKYVSPFYWEDRVSTTDIANGDDVCSASQGLPFDARFWGTTTNSFSVSSNGVTFLNPTACNTSWSNSLSTFITWKAIGFWDDMRTDTAGGVVTNPGVYFDSFANKARVTFETTRYGASADSVKFQIILQPTGNVIFSIDNATNLTNFSPTVGISRGDSTDYIDFTGDIATNKTWIFYLRKYVSPEPSHGAWEGGITNTTTLINYPVLVTVNTQSLISQGKMEGPPNCGADIRFADSDGVTPIEYFTEGPCNDPSTRIWVEVPSIPADSKKIIYLYYGNLGVDDESSLDAVCPGGIRNGLCTEFFDDFSSGIGQWTVTAYDPTTTDYSGYGQCPTSGNSVYWELVGGELHVHSSSYDNTYSGTGMPPCGYRFTTTNSIDADSFIVEIKGNYSGLDYNAGNGAVLWPWVVDNFAEMWGMGYILFKGDYVSWGRYINSSYNRFNITDFQTAYNEWEYIKLGNNIAISSTGNYNDSYSTDAQILETPFKIELYSNASAMDYPYGSWQSIVYDSYWDSASVRKYANPVPETSLKTEETTIESDTYACLSAAPVRDITCTYRTFSCNADETTVNSLSNYTNAHIGNRDKYNYRVCCKITL